MRTKSANALFSKRLWRASFAKAYEEAGYLLGIGVAIAKAREKAGLSQRDLAKRLGTTQSVVSRIEHGNQNLSVKMLAKIAHILRCELSVEINPLKMAA